jgi:phage host-nuclease inhibitor protein Gam
MSYKIIQLSIPEDKIVDENIYTFSPEENYQMIKIGCECLLEAKKVVIALSQKEIYEKVRGETEEEIKKRDIDLIVEREMSKKMEEKITKMYENQIEQQKKQMEYLNQQIQIYESGNKDSLNKEINKVREKYDLLLQEKDYQNKLSREAVEGLKESFYKFTNKSNSLKGSDGEKQFYDYADTFKDFKGFEIIDKHTQGGEGDFHMHFEEFDVLVDVKNYKKKIPIEQREKIKKDLMKNEHLTFAWLVSLNTTIDKYERAPIMYEWINTKQCIVYINHLNSFEDPQKILRIIWFNCKELYRFVEDVSEDDTELTELKEKNYKFMDKIKSLRRTIREINTSINATKNFIQVMDDELREMIETETKEFINSNFSLFDDWWKENIELTNDNSVVLSTDLWFRFKQDNKNMMKELDITVEKFKQYIKSKVPLSHLLLKSKNANSAFDIKGLKLKDITLIVPEEEKEIPKMEIEFLEEADLKKNKSNKKFKKEY